MGGRSAAGPVLDENDTQALAGHVRQLLIEDERDVRILGDVLLSRDACGEKSKAAEHLVIPPPQWRTVSYAIGCRAPSSGTSRLLLR